MARGRDNWINDWLRLIFAGVRLAAKAKAAGDTVYNVNLDLPGNIQMDTVKCQSCGSPLNPTDIKLSMGLLVQCQLRNHLSDHRGAQMVTTRFDKRFLLVAFGLLLVFAGDPACHAFECPDLPILLANLRGGSIH